MTEIRFYHLQKQNLDQALPQILQKALQTKKNIVVRMADEKEVERMNGILWTFKPNTFLPHGSHKNGYADKQPIWLTEKDENPNNGQILVLTQNTTSENLASYNLCCEMLDGRDEKATSAARERWKTYTEAGHDVTYWYQDEKGKWEKKAA